jgi:hypothetical protein
VNVQQKNFEKGKKSFCERLTLFFQMVSGEREPLVLRASADSSERAPKSVSFFQCSVFVK